MPNPRASSPIRYASSPIQITSLPLEYEMKYGIARGGTAVPELEMTAKNERDDQLRQLLTAEARIRELEAAVDQLVDQRDRAVDAADRLAYAIGTVEEIGEHTNRNDPWERARVLLLDKLAQSETRWIGESRRLLGSILDRIDMAPNDDPLPYVREHVRRMARSLRPAPQEEPSAPLSAPTEAREEPE